MKEKLLRAIEENGLIEKGDTVLAAFSGGADSTALLFALSCIRENLGFELIAAHYNHGIRQEADADERFCRETAEMLGLRFFSEKGDVPVFAKENGLSLETAARLLRYRFLSDVAEKTGAASVAVAHHAEDSAESILLHLIRGSGLSGLTGIRYKNTLDLSYAEKAIGKSIKKNLVLIRPLLGCTKEDILSFLEEHEMSYRTDETNYISDTARNRLRLQIIPELEKLNPAAALNIVRAGEILSEDEEFLLSGARKELENAREGEGFSAKKLASLPEPVKKRCLRLALSEKQRSSISKGPISKAFRSCLICSPAPRFTFPARGQGSASANSSSNPRKRDAAEAGRIRRKRRSSSPSAKANTKRLSDYSKLKL